MKVLRARARERERERERERREEEREHGAGKCNFADSPHAVKQVAEKVLSHQDPRLFVLQRCLAVGKQYAASSAAADSRQRVGTYDCEGCTQQQSAGAEQAWRKKTQPRAHLERAGVDVVLQPLAQPFDFVLWQGDGKGNRLKTRRRRAQLLPFPRTPGKHRRLEGLGANRGQGSRRALCTHTAPSSPTLARSRVPCIWRGPCWGLASQTP